MKTKSTILLVFLVVIAFILAQTGNKIFSIKNRVPVNNASIIGWSLNSDTSDMSVSDYKKEIERLKEEINRLKKEEFKFHFDSDKFKEKMKNLAIELDKIKTEELHIKFDFDSEAFKEKMKKLGEEIKNQKLVWKNFDFDMEDFNDDLAELKEELKNKKFEFDFDSEEFKDEMEELCSKLKGKQFVFKDFDIDINLDNLKTDMKNLKVELKKLEAFMKDMKSEMKNDGLIKDVDEDVDLTLNKDEMRVNGEKVSDELHQKYLDLYKKHFDKSLNETFRIHSH
jgi:predicted  nucleic acid-binding Zn-ribbon protein